jgi:hypothetical protein
MVADIRAKSEAAMAQELRPTSPSAPFMRRTALQQTLKRVHDDLTVHQSADDPINPTGNMERKRPCGAIMYVGNMRVFVWTGARV